MKKIFILLIFLSFGLFAQSLFEQQIRKILATKKSIYYSNGIFQKWGPSVPSNLKSMRHSFVKENGYERLVFDFSTTEIPKVYAHLSEANNKIYIDFFDSKILNEVGSLGNSEYVKGINFFPVDQDSLSVEILLKKKMSAEFFFLSNPGRLVIDLKE